MHTLRDLFSCERPTLALQSLLCATAELTSVVLWRVSVLSLLLQGELALRLPRNGGRAWVALRSATVQQTDGTCFRTELRVGCGTTYWVGRVD